MIPLINNRERILTSLSQCGKQIFITSYGFLEKDITLYYIRLAIQ